MPHASGVAPDASSEGDVDVAGQIVAARAMPIVLTDTLRQMLVFDEQAPSLQPLLDIVCDAISACSQHVGHDLHEVASVAEHLFTKRAFHSNKLS
jgi:hypothetical protein